MADSYSDATRTADGSATESWLNDRTLKWVGIAISGLFTLVVAAFLADIIAYQVDPQLFVEIIYPMFFNAFVTVIYIVVVSAVLSLIGGVFIGFGRVSKTRFTNAIASGYVQFFRGTPLLFQLLVIFYGIPRVWPGEFPFNNFAIPAAIIGLTLNHSAYIGEAIRGGIGAVPEGQMEAARSLGMPYVQSMREVILPQAWRNALAAIGNDLVILVKDTSLLTILAVPELVSQYRYVNSNNFDPFTPAVLLAITYLMITVPLSYFVQYLEDRADWGGDNR